MTLGLRPLRLLAGTLVALGACGRPSASATLAPPSSVPIARELHPSPDAAKSPTRLPDQTRSILLPDYRARGRSQLVEELRPHCPKAAASVPLHPHPGPDQEDGGKAVTIKIGAEAIVVTRPGRETYDDEGESYAWSFEWIWAVDLGSCAVHEAATSRYSTSVYDYEDNHRLVGVKRGAPRIPRALRTQMLGAEPAIDDPASTTTLLHQGRCAEYPEVAGLDAWDLVPLLRTPPPFLTGPVVAQRQAFVPTALNTESFEWPPTFDDADLVGVGVVHPPSDAPRVEQTLGDHTLVSVRMDDETMFAVQDSERHRWVATTEGCVPGALTWSIKGDDLVVANVVGPEDEPAKETWMILGRGHGGVVVFDLGTGLAHELRSSKPRGQPLPTTGEMRRELAPVTVK